MTPTISCKGLSKHFGRVSAIDRLELDIPEGSIYALVGHNGAGKTTLIKVLVNILRPTAGSVSVLGADSRRLSPSEFEQIGYVSENQELPDWMTVGYFLEYLKPLYPTWDDELADSLVRDLQLPRDRKLGRLSRGMRMKAALASSLAYRPRLIILDEPFSGLDPLARDEFIRGLLGFTAGTTIFVSSHDLAEIETFASHVAFLDAGRLRFAEDATALANRFREIEVALQTPGPPVSRWPDTWLRPEMSDSLVRFVDSRYDEAKTHAGIAELFPAVTDVTARPMSLRSIFLAVAAGRHAGETR